MRKNIVLAMIALSATIVVLPGCANSKKHVEIGMSKKEVLKKLGDPLYTDNDREVWYYYDSKFSKKYEKMNKLLDSNKESDWLKASDIYDELCGLHSTYRFVHFTNDLADEYYFDTDHRYDEENDYLSWEGKSQKKLTIEGIDSIDCYWSGESIRGASGTSKPHNYEVVYSDKSIYRSTISDAALTIAGNGTRYGSAGTVSWKKEELGEFSASAHLNLHDAYVHVYHDPAACSIKGEGLYNKGDTIRLEAVLNEGYTYDCWRDYLTDEIYEQADRTNLYIFSFDGEGELALSFSTILLEDWPITYDLDNGTQNPANPATYNIEDARHGVELASPTREGYWFDGWYDDAGERISYIDVSLSGAIHLTAHWRPISYSIYYDWDDSTREPGVPYPPSSYTIESEEIVLPIPVKEGYDFAGWYDQDGNLVESIYHRTGDLRLTARWTPKKNLLSVVSEDSSKGSVSIVTGEGYTGESIAVSATPIGDYVFDGWYHDSVRVSGDASFAFTMPTKDCSLVARFLTAEEKQEAHDARLGWKPILDQENNRIHYGIYPNSRVEDPLLIAALEALEAPEEHSYREWYLYGEEYYLKRKAGTWYKCDPISWSILSVEDGVYSVVATNIIAEKPYCAKTYSRTVDGKRIYQSDYYDSDIYWWLRQDFSAAAFLNRSWYANYHDVVTNLFVDGSEKTLNCDYYLLSKEEVKAAFPSEAQRRCLLTPYCKDLIQSTSEYGVYWTRTPDSYSSVTGVGSGGSFESTRNLHNSRGVRPAAQLVLGS